jgi:hypothetical protein
MFEVTVKNGRKIMSRATFDNEDAAWAFFDSNSSRYTCEFKDLRFFRR